LAGTACDRMRLVYLEELGEISIPMPKTFTMFSSFSMASLALSGMSGFVVELVVFFGLITSPKFMLMPKTNYFFNGNRNDINSYLFIIYVTADVLWIQSHDVTVDQLQESISTSIPIESHSNNIIFLYFLDRAIMDLDSGSDVASPPVKSDDMV
jgi:NADH:ubiquinone oxidoreductase subunit 4 (subunit M)